MYRGIIGGGALFALMMTASCAPPPATPGAGLRAPTRTLSDDYLQIVTAERQLVEIDANGRLVRTPAPEGFCLGRDAVISGDDSVYYLMGRCAGSGDAVISVSISNARFESETLDDLASYFSTSEGVASLGLDAGSGAVFLLGNEVEDGVLYATVEDGSGGGLNLETQILCRAFADFNGRLAVVTLMTEKAKTASPEAVQEALQKIVEGWRAANRASS
ncbi:MAG: hypothetical protein AAF401_07260 [Pseudomonadota bacterium]